MAERVDDRVRGFDITKGFIPLTIALTVIVAVVGAIAGGIWWAATMSANQIAINEKLDRVLEIQETVGANKTAVEGLKTALAAEQYRNEALLSWVVTTRIKLAEQGFDTPDLPSGVLRR